MPPNDGKARVILVSAHSSMWTLVAVIEEISMVGADFIGYTDDLNLLPSLQRS
jgi:hypothetical protein